MRKLTIIALILILLISACSSQNSNYKQPNTKEGAEATAEKFARHWEQKDYGSMYDMLIPTIISTITKEKFIRAMNDIESEGSNTIRLDKISKESNDIAYAYYTGSIGAIELKIPAMKMEYSKGVWRINAFTDMDIKAFISKSRQLTERSISLLNDETSTIKLHQNQIRYTNSYDKTYCPKFREIADEGKELYEKTVAMSSSQQFIDIYELQKIELENSYNYFEELYSFCMAREYDEKQQHLSKANEFLKIAQAKSLEISRKLKEFENYAGY